MTARHHDVLVLGVGAMGASTLMHLASRGVSVIGVEQDDVPSARGSSTGETRVIRKAYFEDPRYVPLIERAYVLWSELEQATGEKLLVRTGCLNLGPADHPAILGVRESVARHSLPHEVLTAAEVRARFPAFTPADHDIGVYEDDGGFLRVEACTAAHARIAVERGATLLTRRQVTELAVDTNGVRATLDDGSVIHAGHVVVSAGAWLASHPSLASLAAPMRLQVERQVQLFFRPANDALFSAPAFPAFIHFDSNDRAFYGIPLHGERDQEPALKVCRHHGGEPTTADTLDRTVHDRDVDTVREWTRRRLPTADGPLLRSRVCMYTNTPDHNFVVGSPPDMPCVTVLGGFSGHGFKMASSLGEIAADLATGIPSRFDLSLFASSRFDAAAGR